MSRVACLSVVCALLVGSQRGLAQQGTAPPFPQAQPAFPRQQPTPVAPPSTSRPLPPRPGTTAESRTPTTNPRRGTGSLWTTLGSLAVVVGLVFVAGKFWRKLAPNASRGLPAAAVDVLGRRSLDNRHSVTLLRCGSRILVLAFSPQGVQVLTEMTDPVEVDLLTGLCRQGDEDGSFHHAFLDMFRRSSATDTPEPRTQTEPVGRAFNPSVPDSA